MVNLDVLVVYSADTALSSSVSDADSLHPFSLNSKQANYNRSYAYLLDACEKSGMTAGFTTSADIIGPGTCKTYWTHESGNWDKNDAKAKSAQVFDKVSPVSQIRAAERDLLFSDQMVKAFNDPTLFMTFFDKLETFAKLPEYTLPTVAIYSNNLKSISSAIKKLRAIVKNYHFASDFSTNIILKDRFGSGGNHVYKINRDFAHKIKKIMMKNKDIKFVIQPFLAFDKGFAYKNNQNATDIRLIFHHNLLIQCYLRVAKANDFRCNMHQGGQLAYVTPADIPKAVLLTAEKIVRNINKCNTLYALDFVVSNNGNVYLLEGNIGPGIDWDVAQAGDEKMSKQLIRSIVNEISARISGSAVDTIAA